MKTAQILIVGDEILSGRTADTNSHFLSKSLYRLGIRVEAIATVPDNEVLIAQWVNKNHGFSDFLFVSGGIGGTPDDVTRTAIARAFGVPLVIHKVAEKILHDYYKEKANPDRMSMAELPEGCELITNSVTQAPGFKIKNTYVFAGVPSILCAMFESIKKDFKGGTPLFETELNLIVGEGEIAKYMRQINKEFPQLELGSYPNFDEKKGYRTQLVFRSKVQEITSKALARFKELSRL